MASNKSTDGRVTAFTLLFAFAVVLAAYLSGPENNFWMAPGAIMYMVLLLAIAIPRWPAVGDDTTLTKNLADVSTSELAAKIAQRISEAPGPCPIPYLVLFVTTNIQFDQHVLPLVCFDVFTPNIVVDGKQVCSCVDH